MKLFSLCAALVLLTSSVCLADHELKTVDKGPDGLADGIAALLDPNGYQVTGPDGVVVEVWLAKDLAVPGSFKPSPFRMYPFKSGQLLGAIRVGKSTEFTDFRNQAIPEGTYTLRYGLQPMDGNHVGTSETYDFLLALPAARDKKPTAIASPDDLAQASARSASSTHPAIFSLLDPAKAEDKASLAQEGNSDHWVLTLIARGEVKDGKPAKIRMVVIGHSEG